MDITSHNQNSNARHRKASAKEFYAQTIMTLEEPNHILFCSILFQQYLVDMYAKIEKERFLYIKTNKKLSDPTCITVHELLPNEVGTQAFQSLEVPCRMIFGVLTPFRSNVDVVQM